MARQRGAFLLLVVYVSVAVALGCMFYGAVTVPRTPIEGTPPELQYKIRSLRLKPLLELPNFRYRTEAEMAKESVEGDDDDGQERDDEDDGGTVEGTESAVDRFRAQITGLRDVIKKMDQMNIIDKNGSMTMSADLIRALLHEADLNKLQGENQREIDWPLKTKEDKKAEEELKKLREHIYFLKRMVAVEEGDDEAMKSDQERNEVDELPELKEKKKNRVKPIVVQ